MPNAVIVHVKCHFIALGKSLGEEEPKIESVKLLAIPGHWEGDLLSGGKNSYIATLVERHSRFLMLIKVSGKGTAVVVAALSKHVRKLPATLRRSLTWDRGLEMVKHKSLRWPPMCRSTSAIHKVPGSVGRTRTPIWRCGNTSRETLAYLSTRKRISTRSRSA